MGFSLTPTETFQSTVTMSVKQENGAWKEESFQAIFERTPEDEREDRMKWKLADLLRKVLRGWKMKDMDGADVPFNDANLEAFLKITGAIRAAVAQYWQDNVGAKEKNL